MYFNKLCKEANNVNIQTVNAQLFVLHINNKIVLQQGFKSTFSLAILNFQ